MCQMRFGRLRYYTLGAALLSLFSCNENSSTPIPMEGVEYVDIVNALGKEAEPFISVYELIPLETNDSCLMKSISQIQVTDSFIYVLEDRREELFIFDHQGNFIRSICDKGPGNNEYVTINNVDIDIDRNQLILNDAFSRRIFLYDLKGNWQQTISLSFMPVQIISDHKGNYINLYEGSNRLYESQVMETHHIHRIDTTGEVTQVLLPDQTLGRIDILSNTTASYQDGKLLYLPLLSDTVYEISITDPYVRPRYIFNNLSDYKTLNRKKRKKLQCVYGKCQDLEELEKEDYLLPIGGLLETKSSMLFFFGWDERKYLFYNKHNGHTTLINVPACIQGDNPINKLVFAQSPLATHDDWYYTYLNGMMADMLIPMLENGKTKETLQNMLNNDQNPILIRYKMSF